MSLSVFGRVHLYLSRAHSVDAIRTRAHLAGRGPRPPEWEDNRRASYSGQVRSDRTQRAKPTAQSTVEEERE